MPQLQQVELAEADALHSMGVEILYRFKGWNPLDRCNRLHAICGEKKCPSAFYRVYSCGHWGSIGTPTFWVEVE